MAGQRSFILKQAGLLFSGSLIAQTIGFLIIPVLTRIYAPEDFGALTLFTGITAVITVVSGWRYENAIVVEEDDRKAFNLTQLALFLNLFTAVLILLVIVLFKSVISNIFNISNGNWLYAIPVVLAMTGMTETLINWNNRQKKYRKISVNRVLNSSMSSAYKLSHPSLFFGMGNGLIIGHILGQAFGLLQIAYKTGVSLFKVSIPELKAVAKDYRAFPLYSSPAALLNTVAIYSPVFLLSVFDGEIATAYLGNASKLTYLPMSMLAMAIGQVFYERISRLKDNKEEAASMSHSLVNFLFFIGIIPVVLIAVWGADIIPFLLGKEWEEAGVYSQILILFYFSMFLSNPFSSAFEAYQKLKMELRYSLAFLLVTTTAICIVYQLGYNTRTALMVYVICGILLRLYLLNYFFSLFGKKVILKILIGILLLTVLLWIGFSIK